MNMNSSKKQDQKRVASRLRPVHGLLAAAISALVVMPVAFAGASDGPVATKSASLVKQLKSLKRRVAALESRQTATSTANTTNTTTTSGAPSGPAGGGLTGTYPNPTIGPDKVTGANVAPSSLTGQDIGLDTIGAYNLAPNSVGKDELGGNTVGGSELVSQHAVVGNGVAIAAGGSDSTYVTCPAGERLVAGGYAWQANQTGLSMVASAPDELNPNTTWVVTGRPTQANTLYAWADCVYN
jgi:hypothetical protein